MTQQHSFVISLLADRVCPDNTMGLITETIRNEIEAVRKIVVTGEEGVGKLKKTIDALRVREGVYYLGNPFDYRGNLRPGGYEKYLSDVLSLKKDLHIIPDGTGIMTAVPRGEKGLVLIIDEIYGRSSAEYEKIASLLEAGSIRTILITGCLKNVGRIAGLFDLGLMLFRDDSCLAIKQDFLVKICSILKPEY